MKSTDYPKDHLDRLAAEAADLDPVHRRIVESLLARTPEAVKADEESGDWRRFAGRPFERLSADLAEELDVTERTVRKRIDGIPGHLVGGKSRCHGWRRVRLATAEEVRRHDQAEIARDRVARENAAAGTSGKFDENGAYARGASRVYRASFVNLREDLAAEFLAFVAAFERRVAELPPQCPECGGALETDPSDFSIAYCVECDEEVTR